MRSPAHRLAPVLPLVLLAALLPGVATASTSTGAISGRVTSESSGEPIAGVDVYVDEGYSAVTDSSGSYRIAGLPAGEHVVTFDPGYSAPGFVPEYYDDVLAYDLATPLTVASAEVAGIDAALATGGSLSGTVTAGGAPLADVWVSVSSADGYGYGYGWTGSDGSYVVSGLATGEYSVMFDAEDNYVSEYYDDTASYQDATTVTVAAEQDTPGIDADLAPGGSLSGTVTDRADGAPLQDVSIYVSDPDTGEYESSWTDGQGTYTVDGLSPGPVVVEFYDWDGEYDVQYFDDATRVQDATPMDITVGAEAQGVDAELDKATLGRPGEYVATEPVRVMVPTRIAAKGSTTLTLPDVPEGATAVALNVTVAGVSGNTYVSACAPEVADSLCDDKSIINSRGPDTANFVILKLGGPDGDQVKFYNNAGTVNLIADLQGYLVDSYYGGSLAGARPGPVSDPRLLAAGTPLAPQPMAAAADSSGRYLATDPLRVMEPTRLGSRGATTLTLADVPEGATAVALNVTVAGVSANTYLSACTPEVVDSLCDDKSIINSRGADTANFVVLKLGGPNRDQVKLYNNAGRVDVIADLQGWMVDHSSPDAGPASAYRASDPVRVMEPTTVGAKGTTTLTLPKVPDGATAVALNITVSGVTANTYVAACPPDVPTSICDDKSIINSRGPDTANFVILKLGGPDGDRVKFYNNSGTVNLIADLQGYMVGHTYY